MHCEKNFEKDMTKPFGNGVEHTKYTNNIQNIITKNTHSFLLFEFYYVTIIL